MIDQPPAARPLDPPRLVTGGPLLRASGLRKCYGSIVAVAAVDLEIYPGETVGIVGESGSGKSTVLRLLNLEEPADAGDYRLAVPEGAGGNLFALDRYHRRMLRVQRIGIVYQQPHLGLRMNATSGGNVAERLIMAGERRFATLRAAARGSLAVSEFPAERVDDPPAQLSGGNSGCSSPGPLRCARPCCCSMSPPPGLMSRSRPWSSIPCCACAVSSRSRR